MPKEKIDIPVLGFLTATTLEGAELFKIPVSPFDNIYQDIHGFPESYHTLFLDFEGGIKIPVNIQKIQVKNTKGVLLLFVPIPNSLDIVSIEEIVKLEMNSDDFNLTYTTGIDYVAIEIKK